MNCCSGERFTCRRCRKPFDQLRANWLIIKTVDYVSNGLRAFYYVGAVFIALLRYTWCGWTETRRIGFQCKISKWVRFARRRISWKCGVATPLRWRSDRWRTPLYPALQPIQRFLFKVNSKFCDFLMQDFRLFSQNSFALTISWKSRVQFFESDVSGIYLFLFCVSWNYDISSLYPGSQKIEFFCSRGFTFFFYVMNNPFSYSRIIFQASPNSDNGISYLDIL